MTNAYASTLFTFTLGGRFGDGEGRGRRRATCLHRQCSEWRPHWNTGTQVLKGEEHSSAEM